MKFTDYVYVPKETLDEAFELKNLEQIAYDISQLYKKYKPLYKKVPKEHKKYAEKIDNDFYELDQSIDDLYYRIEDNN